MGGSLTFQMHIDEAIQLAARAIEQADALLIGAGAGMGVDSGLPDFRGTQGFWRAYPAIAKLGMSFAEMANPQWFRSDPRLAWAFYGHRLNLYRNTAPHCGFGQLLDCGNAKPRSYFIYTSNVDGQFQKAGFSAERIVEPRIHPPLSMLQTMPRRALGRERRDRDG
jgi:NAD-dependent SIR2 family protein deacetylase